MNCPKCKQLLFIDRENSRKDNLEYFCIGCSCHGTMRQMEAQKRNADRIFEITLSRVTCKICDKSIPLLKAKTISDGISQTFVCRTHKEKRI